MKIQKIVLRLLTLLMLAFAAFYFWSTSGTQSEYLAVSNTPVETTPANDSLVQIMTYNVGYLSGMTNNEATRPEEHLFKTNLEKLLRLLENNTPDIICFQEIDYSSKRSCGINLHDTLASHFYPWSVRAVNWDKKYVPFPYWPPSVHFGKILSGQSILSKWKLENPSREVLAKVASNPFYYNAYYLDRLLATTTVENPTKDFLLMNLHAEAFDTLTRNDQLALVYERFKKEAATQPVILAGDFNATAESDEPGIHRFLNDTTIGCTAFHPGTKNYFTFSSGKPEERIDYIFYTKKDFAEISGRVLTEFGEISDHLPVEAILKIR